MDPLPTRRELFEDISAAVEARSAAASLRRGLRRRRGKRDPERTELIERTVKILSRHSSIMRSHLKRSDYHAVPYGEYRQTIRDALSDLRRERRRLRKMLPS